MSNWITAYFEASGAAQTGLTVLVYARDLSDNSVVVNGVTMTEVGNGWYKYDWTTYDKTKAYVGYCDSQSASSDDRYVPIEFKQVVDVETIEGTDTAIGYIDAAISALPSAADVRDAVYDGTIDEAAVGATPTTFKGKLQAIWNRQFTNRKVTSILETAYEKDDTTVMETWDLTINDSQTKRER
jgi:hypothetical protein